MHIYTGKVIKFTTRDLHSVASEAFSKLKLKFAVNVMHCMSYKRIENQYPVRVPPFIMDGPPWAK